MAEFVYSNGSLPEGKQDSRPLTTPANKAVTATEWNSVMQDLKDIRAAILAVSGSLGHLKGDAIAQPLIVQGGRALTNTDVYHILGYLSPSSDGFNVDETITGGTSGAVGIVMSDNQFSPGLQGTLKLKNLVGIFVEGETITGNQSGQTATSQGTGNPPVFLMEYYQHTSLFYVGQTIQGQDSGATAILENVQDSIGGLEQQSEGLLTLSNIVGTFQAGELIFDPNGTAANTGVMRVKGLNAVTVYTTAIKATDVIWLQHTVNPSGPPLGQLVANPADIVEGVSFDVFSTDNSDVDAVSWRILKG